MCAHDGSHLCAWDSAEQRSAQCDGAEQLYAQVGAQFDAAVSACGLSAHGGSQHDANLLSASEQQRRAALSTMRCTLQVLRVCTSAMEEWCIQGNSAKVALYALAPQNAKRLMAFSRSQ